MKPDLEYVLSATPGISGSDFDPRSLIRSVNALYPLGKDRALDAIEVFLRRHPLTGGDGPCNGMFLVLRCLFEVPASRGSMPLMMVGAPYPPEPSDHRLIPRFPLVVL